jgi:hypothetical protein
MNQESEIQYVSGSVDTLADEIRKVMLKGARSPEENKKRKAELDFAAMKKRIIGRERRLEELKERTRRKLRGEIDDEW